MRIEKVPLITTGDTKDNKYTYSVMQLRADLDVLMETLNKVIDNQQKIIDVLGLEMLTNKKEK